MLFLEEWNTLNKKGGEIMASIDVKIVDLKKQRFQLSNTYKSVQKIEKELYDIEKVLGDITGADVYHAIQHRIGKTAEAIEKNEETLIMMREVLDEVITI